MQAGIFAEKQGVTRHSERRFCSSAGLSKNHVTDHLFSFLLYVTLVLPAHKNHPPSNTHHRRHDERKNKIMEKLHKLSKKEGKGRRRGR